MSWPAVVNPGSPGDGLRREPASLLLLTSVDLHRGLPQRTHHLVHTLSERASVTVVDLRAEREKNDIWYKVSRSLTANTVFRRGNPDHMTVEAAFSAYSRLAPWSDLQVIRFIRRAIRRTGRRWDVCLAQGPICGAAASPLKASLFDTLVYEDLDDFPAFFPSRGLVRHTVALLEQRSLRSADMVISVSDLLAERARNHGAREVSVVPNGSDWKLFTIPSSLPPPYSAVYVGSLEEWAGVEMAVEAIASLRHSGVDASLRIYGRGSPANESRLARAIERTATGGSISLEGVVDYRDLPEVLTQARVGLIPFVPGRLAAHAFPLKAVEYMSAGLNVVGTRVGGLGRLLTELRGGRAADYNVAAFADAIANAAEVLTLEDMAANRAAVATYDWPLLIESEWQLIRRAWKRSVRH